MSSQAFYEDKKGRDLMLSILTYHLAPRLVYYMYVIRTTMYDTCVPVYLKIYVAVSIYLIYNRLAVSYTLCMSDRFTHTAHT